MKKLIINLEGKHRTVHSKAELNKKARRKLYWFLEPGGSNAKLGFVPAKDRAGFGSTLHVEERNGEKLIFQLVMPEDADAAKGLISTTSPIGRAFLNKEPGDSVKVVTPGGTREFDILKLFTIHDEASE